MASEPSKRVQASATVTMTVRIAVPDCWGADCAVDQIHRQAKESALGILNRMRKPNEHLPFAVIGEPEVTAILLENER